MGAFEIVPFQGRHSFSSGEGTRSHVQCAQNPFLTPSGLGWTFRSFRSRGRCRAGRPIYDVGCWKLQGNHLYILTFFVPSYSSMLFYSSTCWGVCWIINQQMVFLQQRPQWGLHQIGRVRHGESSMGLKELQHWSKPGNIHSHGLQLWYIYLHVFDFPGKFSIQICHAWILWDCSCWEYS